MALRLKSLLLSWLFNVIATAAIAGPPVREPEDDAHSLLQYALHTHESSMSNMTVSDQSEYTLDLGGVSMKSRRVFAPKVWRAGADVPTIVIDFDLPPVEKWRPVMEYYREVFPFMMRAFKEKLDKRLSPEEQAAWVSVASSHIKGNPELAKEYFDHMKDLDAMVEIIGDPEITRDLLTLHSMVYELGSMAVVGCAGLLAAMPNGTVVHGRNMEYRFKFDGPGGVQLDWPNVTYNGLLVKGGKPFAKSTMWAAHSFGAVSILRFADETGSGWSFEQNTRRGARNSTMNFAAAKLGGSLFARVVKYAMMKTADFTSAVDIITRQAYIAPQYFVMAGGNPYEGAVITVDAVGNKGLFTPQPRFLSASNWALAQTNDDLNKPPLDTRRAFMFWKARLARQRSVSVDKVREIMTSFPTANWMSVYTNIWVPATGYAETILY